jgi:hypothetical protein
VSRLRWGLGGLVGLVALAAAAQSLRVYLQHGLWLGAAAVAVLVAILIGGLLSLGRARLFLSGELLALDGIEPAGQLYAGRRTRLVELRQRGVEPDLEVLGAADSVTLAGRAYLGRYVVATAVLVGLIGTFAGLMETLRRVAPLLDDAHGRLPALKLLAAPLAGLDVTFGASIVGILVTLALSLVQGDLGIAEELVLARLEERVRHQLLPSLWPAAESATERGLALLAGSRGELVGMRGELVGARGELVGARGELVGARGELTAMRADLDRVTAGLGQVSTAMGGVRGEMAEVRGDLGRLAGRLEGMVERLGLLPGELSTSGRASAEAAAQAVARAVEGAGERLAERAGGALERGESRLADLVAAAAGAVEEASGRTVGALERTASTAIEAQAARMTAIEQAQGARLSALEQAQAARLTALEQAQVARLTGLEEAQAVALRESRTELLVELRRAVGDTHQELATLVEHHGVTLGETTQALLLELHGTLSRAGHELTRTSAELAQATGSLDRGAATLGTVMHEVAPQLSQLGPQLGALTTELALLAARADAGGEAPLAMLEELGRLGEGLDRLLALAELRPAAAPVELSP